MIEKISLKSIGCLSDLESPALKKIVLIFGENGTGKTTLASVLSSLKQNAPSIITERASLHVADANPHAILTIAGDDVKFADGSWEKAAPKIAVFDSAYINRNIHSGDQLENEHKKQLYTVILGDTCASQLKEQAELAETILEHNRSVKELEKNIEEQIEGDLSLKDFLKLDPVDDVGSKIEKQKAVIALFEKSDSLNAAEGFEEIEVRKLPSSFKQTLGRTVDSIAGDVEELVNQHLQGSTNKISMSWIEAGIEKQKNDDCPFCGESTAGNSLVKAYSGFFSDAYNGLKTEINSLAGMADGYFGESVLLKQQKKFEGNKTATEFWADYIDVPPLDHSIFEELSDEIGENRDQLKKAIQEKKENPLDKILLDDDSVTISDELKQRIEDYNTLSDVANKRIEEVRESQKKGDLYLETEKLNKLLAVQTRHSKELSAQIGKWESADAVKEKLSEKRKSLQQSIEEETTSVFEKQGDSINAILEKLESGFRLSKFDTNNRTKPPSVQICVELSGKRVKLGDKHNKSQRPFRSTLSGAERTMLALAFFVSKLEMEGSLPETIVVLDDPITNFDQIRLDKTAKIVSESLTNSNQLIVMSHDQEFLQTIGQNVDGSQQLVLSLTEDNVSSLK